MDYRYANHSEIGNSHPLKNNLELRCDNVNFLKRAKNIFFYDIIMAISLRIVRKPSP